MFKNFFITGWRHILQHKLFSIINIGGLAIGLAAAILILLFVRDEFSWDRWVPNAENIYRVELKSFPAGREPFHLSVAFTPIAEFFEQDFEAVQHVTKMRLRNRTVAQNGEFFSQSISFVDPNFLDVFQLDMLHGDIATAMRDPSAAVLNASTAVKYFGETNVLGETLTLTNGNSYRVTGVFADLPANSHMDLSMLLPLSYAEFPPDASGESALDAWFNLGTYIYLKLHSPDQSAAVQAAMPDFLDRRGPRPTDTTIPSERWNLGLINVRDIHLEGAPLARIKPLGSRSGALIFASIALLILMIGCFNFINLSTAKASLRAKEVAVRKVFGASKAQLFTQFIGEVGLIVVIAFALALILVEATLPWYNEFISKVLSLDLVRDPMALIGMLSLLVIVVLGAGSHPAMMITSFKPSDTLKAGARRTTGSARIRSVLVGLQFAIAIGLIVCSAIVYSQVQYGLSRDTGFNEKNMLVVGQISHDLVQPRWQSLKQTLLSHPDIMAATFSSASPVDSFTWLDGYASINGEQIEPVVVNGMSVDSEFFSTYQIEILAGRVFEEARLTDIARPLGGDWRPGGVVLSQSAARKLGFSDPQDAIGVRLGADESLVTVVGVVADIHNGSARSEVRPYAYSIDEESYRRLNLRHNADDEKALLAEVDAIWAELVPEVPVYRTLLEDEISSQYTGERSRGLMFAIFAGLAVFIASLGLYGLSAFTIEQKTREIGVRKVLGASVQNIVRHLVWQSSKPVLFANVIAWPVAWYFMSGWLDGFTYRVDLTATPFMLAALIAMLISVVSVGSYAWMVARSKPVNALRYE